MKTPKRTQNKTKRKRTQKENKRTQKENDYKYAKLGLVIKKIGLGKWKIIATELGEVKDLTVEELAESVKELEID